MKGALEVRRTNGTELCHGEAPTFMNGGTGWIGVCLKCKLAVGPFRLMRDAKKAWNALPVTQVVEGREK